MIPMACPSCGRGGNVPNDKLNTRLHCKKCDTIFHIDMSGHIMLGEPVSVDDLSAKRARAAVQDRTDPIADLVDSIKSLPKVVRYAGGVIGVVLAVVFALPLVGIHFVPEPETPDQVSVRAARALLEGDVEALRAVATSKSAGDAAGWIANGRPLLFPGVSPGPNPSAIIGSTRAVSHEKDGDVRTEVMVIPPGPTPGSYGTSASFYVQMFQVGRSWKVDVSQSMSLRPTTRIRRTNLDAARDPG